MATASLTADLLARKGTAKPTGQWLRNSQVMIAPATPKKACKDFDVLTKAETVPEPTVNKHLRLGRDVNKKLKLLAARTDQSQQAVMEKAVRHYLMCELEKADCICGSDL